jgi:hypothetical protein
MPAKPIDNQTFFSRFARGVTYFAYGFSICACLFLLIGFVLLLFGANPTTPFVKFVYHGASIFLQPFREIFPTHQLGPNSYFDGAALFASLMYILFAMGFHALIAFLNNKIKSYDQV